MEKNFEILNELLKSKNVRVNDFIFKFEESKSVASKILKSFKEFYDKDEESFPLSFKDGKSDGRYGIITDIMALSTYLELQSLEIVIAGEDAKIFCKLISRIFASVYREETPVFDASPYTAKEVLSSYVETASKIIPTMVDLRDDLLVKLNANKDFSLAYEVEFPENLLRRVNSVINADFGVGCYKSKDANLLRICAEKLIIDSIRMLNDSSIINGDGSEEYLIDGKKVVRAGISESTIKYRGWSFKKPLEGRDDEYDTSLFYTYLASNAFISLYNSMENFYDALDENKNPYEGENPEFFDSSRRSAYNKFIQDEQFYRKNADVLNQFRFATACAGRYIDSVLRKKGINISFTYVDKDLNAVTMGDLLSGENNHVMNSLFAYAILLNAGVDDDYNTLGKKSMYQTLQFALNNIKKIYTEFKDQEREDLIDSFTMGDERCPNEERKIMQAWRKSKLPSPYDLVPLYFNTYNLISDYIIKYPQKEMLDNLIWVMENKDETHWFWTKNGFNLNNNLYYILSLDYFYIYYYYYEQPIIAKYEMRAKEEQYNKEIAQLKKAHSDALTALKREEEEALSAQKAVFNSQIEQLQNKLDETANTLSPLEQQVENFVRDCMEKMWQEQFNKGMIAFVDEALARCLSIAVANDKNKLSNELKKDKQFTSALLLASLESSTSNIKVNLEDISDAAQMDRFKAALLDSLFTKMFRD